MLNEVNGIVINRNGLIEQQTRKRGYKMNERIFQTGKRLQIAIDNPEKFEGMQDYLDRAFAYLMFDQDGDAPEKIFNGAWFEVPYWIEKYHNKLDDDLNDKYLCEYIPGHYEPLKYGHIQEYEGKQYKYIDSQSLSEEMEHQANDGKYIYENRGYSFLRIWRLV